ncbi:uncharacterized protein LOC118766647 [Octopus sinensis]|uniref:Uncharacterized protein LOC118766647 n=1 Tax=Octopus sinensis TaxID=2607531 RepID=A0A7E6FEW4_9MOLL|nr:uncharacterized protein LOC118766647 [Octopus sinensis]
MTTTAPGCNFLGREPNLFNCSKYFECISGVKVEKSCGQNEHFDGDQRQCYPAVFAKCIRKDCNYTGRRANPNDCKKYFECKTDGERELSCGPDELFDYKQKNCYPAVFAECKPGSRITTTALPTTTLPPCKSTGRRPNKNDCKKYFECINNVEVELSCGPDELFDYIEKNCYPAVFAECTPGSITTTTALPTTTTTTLPTTTATPCTFSGRKPNENDCKKYFECINNVEVELSCGPDENFDYIEKNCYPAVFAECTPGSITTTTALPTTTTTTLPTTTATPCTFSGRKPNENDCKKYFECINNVEVELSCGPDENFDYIEKNCYPAVFAECTPGSITTTTALPTTTTTTLRQPTATPCTFSGRKPNENDCKKYFECINKVEVELSCGPDELFDYKEKNCYPAVFAECTPGSITTTTALPTTTLLYCGYNGRIPNENDCKKYFECINNVEVEFSCGPDENFDYIEKNCYPAVFAQCTPSSIPKPCNFLGRRADPNDCEKYSECVNNAEVEYSCNPGELFDDGSKMCYPAAFVTCKQGAVNTNTAKLCNFVGRIPDANDCQSYKECVNGKVVVQRCGSGEVFDTANLMCLPSVFGQCNVAPKSRKRRDTSDVCSEVKAASKVPYPGDPRKYYYCSKTRKQAVFQCNDGYIFSEKDGACVPNS